MDERDERARLKRLKDFADLQDENAGRDTGKMRRFTRDDDTLDAASDERRIDALLFLETLTIEQRTQRLRNRLAELDRASLEALREAERDLREVQERAAVDEDGRRMYRTEDGRTAYYEDGTEVSRAVQNETDWTGKPTWEEFGKKRQARDDAKEFHDRVQEAQAELENGNSLTDERLDELELEFDDNVPDSVQAKLAAPSAARTSAAREYAPANGAGAEPSSLTAFNDAADGRAPVDTPTPGRAPPQPTETFAL